MRKRIGESHQRCRRRRIIADGLKLLAFSSQGLDTTAWVSFDLATGKRDIIGLDKRVDVKRAWWIRRRSRRRPTCAISPRPNGSR